MEARGLQRERLVDLAEQAVVDAPAAGDAALQVGDRTIEAIAEGLALGKQEERSRHSVRVCRSWSARTPLGLAGVTVRPRDKVSGGSCGECRLSSWPMSCRTRV